jgi:hypothetical protein
MCAEKSIAITVGGHCAKKAHHFLTAQLLAQDRLLSSVDAMQLKDMF